MKHERFWLWLLGSLMVLAFGEAFWLLVKFGEMR